MYWWDSANFLFSTAFHCFMTGVLLYIFTPSHLHKGYIFVIPSFLVSQRLSGYWHQHELLWIALGNSMCSIQSCMLGLSLVGCPLSFENLTGAPRSFMMSYKFWGLWNRNLLEVVRGCTILMSCSWWIFFCSTCSNFNFRLQTALLSRIDHLSAMPIQYADPARAEYPEFPCVPWCIPHGS
jgi:hypothetical protein